MAGYSYPNHNPNKTYGPRFTVHYSKRRGHWVTRDMARRRLVYMINGKILADQTQDQAFYSAYRCEMFAYLYDLQRD